MVFRFDLATEEDVILVNSSIGGKFEFRLALDIAATHTTIDSSVLYFSGYELRNSKGEKDVETSNGIVMVELYEIEDFTCLGISKDKFEVQVYDFLAHGIVSDYDGVVGLDFLREHKLCIDLRKGEIEVDKL